MKRLLLILALLVTPACHPPATIVTPQGQTAFSADQISVRVTELEKSAIAANSQKLLSDADTAIILQASVTIQKTLAATPDGWRAAVKAAWADARFKLPATANPSIAAAIGAVDVAIGAL